MEPVFVPICKDMAFPFACQLNFNDVTLLPDSILFLDILQSNTVNCQGVTFLHIVLVNPFYYAYLGNLSM